MIRSLLIVTFLVGCGLAPGCARDDAADTATSRPTIVATIYPLADLVTQLVGDATDVLCLLPPGQSPHAFELSPRQMAQVGHADVILAVGLGLDHWIDRAAATANNSATHRFTLADALQLAHDHHDHDHAHDHDCSVGTDPHLWLDPVLMQQALPAMTESLIAVLPDHAEAIRQRAGELEAELIGLDAEFADALEPFAGRSIVTFHSAFNRLAERYGLQVATTLSPIESIGTVSPAALDAAIKAVQTHQLKVIFAEPQFSPDAAKMLADRTGVQVLILDPIGDPNSTDRNGYFPMMRYNLSTLLEGLRR